MRPRSDGGALYMKKTEARSHPLVLGSMRLVVISELEEN